MTNILPQLTMLGTDPKRNLLNVLAGVGGPLINAAIGTRSARDASGNVFAGTQQAVGEQRAAMGDIRETLSPYTQAGSESVNILREHLTNPTADAGFVRELPGYKFRFDEGVKALERSQAARGDVLSGRGMKELMRWGQGLADTYYDDYINNLFGLSSTGLSAAGTEAGHRAALAGNVGNALIAGGQARAAGELGQGDAWGGAVSDIATNLITLTQSAAGRELLESIFGPGSADQVAQMAGSGGGGAGVPGAGAAAAAGGAGVTSTVSPAIGATGGPAAAAPAGYAAPGSSNVLSGPGGGSIFETGAAAGGAAIPGVGTITGTVPAGAPVTGALANEIATTGAVGASGASGASGAAGGSNILSGNLASTFGQVVAPIAIGGLMLQGIMSMGDRGKANTQGTHQIWQQIEGQPDVTINGATGKQFEFAGRTLLGLPGSYVVMDPKTKELFTMDFTKGHLGPIRDANQILNSPISGGMAAVANAGGDLSVALRNIYAAFGTEPPADQVQAATARAEETKRRRREDSLAGRG